MRGKGPAMSPGHITCGITPACAGKRHCKRFSQLVYWDHPRMCGEKKSFANSIEMELGSPPHVRGKGGFRPSSYLLFRITPACAGKSFTKNLDKANRKDHPRMCGEKLCILLPLRFPTGSPPHVRGKVHCTVAGHDSVGITPACAGKSCVALLSACLHEDHPRMCGEKHQWKTGTNTAIGSPPHVRGKVCLLATCLHNLGITPACAGKRHCKVASGALSWDHPRMCGEKVLSKNK